LSFDRTTDESGTQRGLLTLRLQSGMTVVLPVSPSVATQICDALSEMRETEQADGLVPQ
jgi:hypothetical protein